MSKTFNKNINFIYNTGGSLQLSSNTNTIGNVIFTTGGNVGIGTTSPSARLHIHGTSASLNGPHIWIGNTGSSTPLYQQLNWSNDNIASSFDMYYDGQWRTSASTGYQIYKLSGNLNFNYATGSAGSFASVLSTAMTVASTGNIGIRTTAPAYALEVNGVCTLTNNTKSVNMSISPNNGSFGTIECFTSGNTAKLPLYLNPYGGLVGIGTTAAQSSFTTTLNNGVHISGASGVMDNGTYGYCQIVLNDTDIAARSHLTLIRAGQSVSFFRVNTSNQLVLSMGSAGVYLANNATSWTAVSDRKMKTDFADILSPLDKLSHIKGTYYRYLTDSSDVKRIGVIAQDVQAVLPEAVSEDIDGVLGVSYTDMIPLAIEAIKELKTKNGELQTYIQSLEARLTKLEQLL